MAATATSVAGSMVLPAAANAAGQVSSTTDVEVHAVSCAPGGSCAAGGEFFDLSSRRTQAFVLTETNGTWSRLTTVLSARVASVNITGVQSLSCTGAKNCTATGGQPAFAATEVNGRWGKAVKFSRHDKNGQVMVSCASAGNCTAGWGNFVASEKNGRWGTPTGVPNVTALGKRVSISSVSCTSTVNCAVGGTYVANRKGLVFVANEKNGHWPGHDAAWHPAARQQPVRAR